MSFLCQRGDFVVVTAVFAGAGFSTDGVSERQSGLRAETGIYENSTFVDLFSVC